MQVSRPYSLSEVFQNQIWTFQICAAPSWETDSFSASFQHSVSGWWAGQQWLKQADWSAEEISKLLLKFYLLFHILI